MSWGRRVGTLAAGLLAGVVAALFMTLLMVAMRYWLGISPPPEAGPDRFAPTIDIKTFFELFTRFGGYTGLKKFGIISGLAGLFGIGAVVGVVYAAVTESGRARRSGDGPSGVSRLSLLFISVLAAVMWIATAILLWPVLATNYRGLPPSRARLASLAGLLVAYLGFAAALVVAYRFVTRRETAVEVDADDGTLTREIVGVGRPVGRRAVLAGIAGAVLALPSYALMKRLYDRATFAYDGRPFSGPGVTPIAPNDRFYSVTKNVVDPNVDADVWGLEISGLVEHGRRYSFDDLKALPATKQETTLMCISNKTGAGLFSDALWTGVPMADLLHAAGVKPGAVEVKLHAADGYTDTFSIEKALDPTTMVVYQMNGEALPQIHGFPARLVVPGLFGEKNVKWVTGIEVIDHDGKGFYETQGWGPNFEIPTRSDIFAPQWTRGGSGDAFNGPIRVNQRITIKGRAFAGARGVKSIEISVDGEKTWLPVTIDYPGTKLTWVFWSHVWTPGTAGDYTVTSRAVDGDGVPQSTETRGIVAQGATGYHRVVAHVA